MNTEVAISLGSNLGDRLDNLVRAKHALQSDASTEGWAQSGVFKTAPVDCPTNAPEFYNAVVKFDFHGTPEDLLDLCQKIEREAGRDLELKKLIHNAPRVVDLDILYYGEKKVSTERLIIPHQRMHERRFVLEPLAVISPDVILPGKAKTVSELLNVLSSEEPPLTLVSKEW